MKIKLSLGAKKGKAGCRHYCTGTFRNLLTVSKKNDSEYTKLPQVLNYIASNSIIKFKQQESICNFISNKRYLPVFRCVKLILRWTYD